MNWILYTLGGIVALLIVATIVGACLPRDHEVSRSIDLPAPPEEVWGILTDYQNQSWRQGFEGVERKPDEHGKEVWLEKAGKYNEILLRTDVADAPGKLVRTIADPKSPFLGSWTYELEKVGDKTRLTITERGVVKPPIFRLIGKLANMATSTIDRYQSDLAKKLSQ